MEALLELDTWGRLGHRAGALESPVGLAELATQPESSAEAFEPVDLVYGVTSGPGQMPMGDRLPVASTRPCGVRCPAVLHPVSPA